MSPRLRHENNQFWREQVIKARRKWWRVRTGLDELPTEHPDRPLYLAQLHAATFVWLLETSATFKRLAEQRADDQLGAYWTEHPFGEYTGLEGVKEVFMGAYDGEPSEVVMIQVGAALDETSVLVYDLPRQPPVIDEPWHPNETN